MGISFTEKNVKNFIIYFSSKLIVLLVPIFLSFRLNREDYILFEVFLSMAQIVAPLILLGIHSSYGYYCISNDKKEYSIVIKLYLCISLSILSFLGIIGLIENYLIFLVILQIFFTAFFQVQGEIQQSYFVSSVIYLIILLMELFSINSKIIFYSFLIYIYIYIYIYIKNELHDFNWLILIKILKFGGISTILGIIISSLTLGARAILETVASQDQIFAYSLNWRYISILPLIAFQFISSLLNHKLYKTDFSYVERYVKTILPFIILAVVLGNLTCYYLLEHLYDNYENDLQLSLFVSYQIYFWILIVLSEVVINRFNIDRIKVILCASIIIVSAFLIYIVGDFSNYISLLFLINTTLFILILALVLINKIKIILYLSIPVGLSNFILYIMSN